MDPERRSALAAGRAAIVTVSSAPPRAFEAEKTAGSADAGPQGATGGPPPLQPSQADLFARYTSDYVADRAGRQVAILHAGCSTAAHDLGAQALRDAGADICVTLVDDDCAVTRAALAARPELAGSLVGDLRSVPLPPRSQDVVHCALLLDRIHHAELVLDRLIATIKPGGLLLVRIRDRDSAAGFFDRIAPGPMRRLVWRARHPGRPGPYPAVFERVSSPRGLQSFALLRGLVFAERRAVGGTAGALARGPHGFLLAQRLVSWLSHGRLTAAHEEILFVLRKPENRFARLV